ncbi:MYND finger domain-containing protein [Hirsutella rhossiliensis]|uniref:MYND finger domain-containing protein n=1 Tax=Hirsutella rhossiliensis TaxID=111463 RepID=A0A9P8MQS0_9HYPO|nr:MYND finger domain-containing protein [Hirsutella rhossiliensis]KAH0959454.1 MYND finger domain-containing protein [Hirsutella rhossiliensis]
MPLIMNADVDQLNGLAPRACELCRLKDNVKRCAACQAVYYCGRECQLADRDEHKIACNVVKKARLHYEREYVKLRDMPGDALTPERMFETCVGHFWGILETRPYMRARYGLVDSLLLSYGTAGGPAELVQTALDHLLDMMRLCRGDNMGLRQVIPALYIRLARDQDAYDLIKWYATTGQDPDYDWGDMDLPFLDIHDADVLEPLPAVRVLLDLRAVQNAGLALYGAKPQEIVDLIRGHLVGPVLRARPELLLAQPDETARLAHTIKTQIQQLYHVVHSYSPHFWDLLIENPDAGVLQRPSGPYAKRSRDEALLMVGYCYAAWYETPGAVDVLRSLGDTVKTK